MHNRYVGLIAALMMWLAVSAFARDAPQRVTGDGITGHVERHGDFPSGHVPARNVDVWLPPGYASSDHQRYPVLYMHDGQNVFDPATSYTGIDWAVDEAMTRLVSTGQVREAIVVAVWNTPRRLQEYMPRKPITAASFTPNIGDPPFPVVDLSSDAYLRFLVEELKPFVDTHYRTLTGPEDTAVMGSSLGGLISAYAVTEHPNIFGRAGCVSTHWPAGQGIVVDYLAAHLPQAGTLRWYFDYGTATIDASYEPYQQRVDPLMQAKGYRAGKDWITRRYTGAEHNEAAWRERIEVPLVFLLSP
ncbi:alpha/beta hydrolase-fold protein [Pseudoxanthomonas sp. SL93]|uniref:alpha/beta hydrolase n=1 Tax=Pseudoxanthomonas sp. SL93 TaxID=2995142 RepID=UPI00226E7469|nr:alpha/beta hydrolase-fold protein [Pseudoxanthomonas sp. SL93]WAC64386.1 alpha/beta hydrolase-fold protein [Pseudoxanthomonas sp. SL93]